MRQEVRRFDVELISPDVLRRYMKYREYNLQSLADAVTRKRVPTSKATIGHLTNGHIKRTKPERAKAICEVLDVPLDALFVAKVSTVQRDVPPSRTRAA